MKFTTLLTLFCSVSSAYVLPRGPTKTFKFVGNIRPTGFFDPLKISENVDEHQVKYFREAELQHGRAAMASMVALPLIDMFSDTLAIDYLKGLPAVEQAPFWLSMACFEFARMNAGWENPFITKDNKYFRLNDSYQPGNVIKLDEKLYSEDMMEKELSNGRLAMIGSVIYILQEACTHVPIVN